MPVPMTAEEYMNLLKVPETTVWKPEYWEQQQVQYPQTYEQGGFVVPYPKPTDQYPPDISRSPCMAVMEQPGMWLVENTKRKLLTCNEPVGHSGNHRFSMEWQREPMKFANTQAVQAVDHPYYAASWQSPETHFIDEVHHKKWVEEALVSKKNLIPENITVSFEIDKEQEK